MTDKERILTTIIDRITAKYAYDINSMRLKESDNVYWDLFNKRIKEGDIVVASTCLEANDFTVGIVKENCFNEKGYYLVQELGSNRLCEYRNVAFYILNKKMFGKYDFLYGRQYKVYSMIRNVLKGGYYKFSDLTFIDDKYASFSIREPFEDEIFHTFTFEWQSITKKEFTKRYNEELSKKWEEDRKGKSDKND